jgi:4-amino-4-deoxy-L-arabinose transferase-like glycosyltransferase
MRRRQTFVTKPIAVLAAIVVASVAVRAIYYRQLAPTPFLHLERWAQSDMHYYDGWARQIAGGDWLSATVPMPMHRWHHEVAQRFFASHPGERAAFDEAAARTAGRADADTLVWSRWMRAPVFYQDPLYPYLVAATYRLTGADPRHVFAGQLAIGVLTNVLVWSLARRYFGDAVGACAGAIAVLFGPLLFYEMLLLRDSLIAFTGLLLVWLTDRAVHANSRRRDGLLGFALGVACLLKSTFVLAAAAIVPVTLFTLWRHRRPLLMPALAMTAGLAIALAPLVARNLRVGAPPLSLASSGPMTFVAANEVDARPDVGFGIDTALLAGFLGETGGGWGAAITTALEGHNAGSYLALEWRKFDRIWYWFEIPNNESFYYMRLQAPVLAWLPLTFWTCAPLALVGLWLGRRSNPGAWPLYLLVAVTVLSMAIFYTLGRFRVSLAAAAIPFAALTLVELWRWARDGRVVRTLATAGAIVLLGAWTGRALAADQIEIRTADWILAYSAFYQDRVYGALDRKAWMEGARWYLEFFEKYEPTSAQILASRDPRLAPELADMHNECAQILKAAGETALAEGQLDRAKRILALRPFP